MNISHSLPIKAKYMMSIGAVVFLSTMFSLFAHTPTHALSLDLGTTVSNVASSVPIVNTITPLLMTTPAQTSAPTAAPQPQTKTVAPVETNLINTPVISVSTTTTPSTSTPSANSTSSDAASSTSSEPNTSASSTPSGSAFSVTSSRPTQTGLSSLAKQTEALQAPAHIPSPALMYSTNQISAKLATVLFYLGVTGVFVGGCVIFATRPKMGIS